jgi:hypothetical protein
VTSEPDHIYADGYSLQANRYTVMITVGIQNVTTKPAIIVMNPILGKRLAMELRSVIKEYEREFGPLDLTHKEWEEIDQAPEDW